MRRINVFGKDCPVLPRYSAIKTFCGRKGIDLFEFPVLLASYRIGDEDFKVDGKFIDDMAGLMYAYLERGAEAADEVLQVKLNDVIDWIMDGNIATVYELTAEAQGLMKEVKEKKTSSQAMD